MKRSLRAPAVSMFLAAAVIAGCAHGGSHRGGRGARTRPTPAPVPLASAKPTTLKSSISISGIVAPFQNVAITSSLTEPVDDVRVLQGARVSKGQVLAVLDTADLRAQLQQAHGTLESDRRAAASAAAKATQARYTARLNIGTGTNQVRSAKAAVVQAQATLANDTSNLDRDQKLVAQGYLAQQTLDQQRTTVLNDQAAVRSAQAALQTALTNEQVNGNAGAGLQAANVASAVADANSAAAAIETARGVVAQNEAQIAKATIVSPVDGIVVNRNVNPGEYPSGRTLFTVQQLSNVYANLNASSAQVFAIPKGAAVALTVSGQGGYKGTVSAVLGQVTPGSTNFTVQAIVANPDGRLQAGLPVTGTISLPPVSGVGIPTAAFLDDSHTSIMEAVPDDDGNLVAKTVTVSERTSDGTNSIVAGVASGQRIVANGQLGLSDGQSLGK